MALREKCPNTEFSRTESRKIRTRKNSVFEHSRNSKELEQMECLPISKMK